MTSTISEPVAAAPSLVEALGEFPYEEWISMPAAARRLRERGVPASALTTVVRYGRRKGFLRTCKEPANRETLVMRVRQTPSV